MSRNHVFKAVSVVSHGSSSGRLGYVLDSMRASELNKEITSIDDQISDLQRLRADLVAQASNVKQQLNSLSGQPSRSALVDTSMAQNRTSTRHDAIDYTQEFDWTSPMKDRMKQVFSIRSFRLCQEGFVVLLPSLLIAI